MTTTQLAPRAPAMAMGTLEDPAELGRVLAASGYFQDAREAAQAVVKVLAGAELGFGPIASMTGVYIVKGRVTLSANLMAAAIKRHPKYDYRVREHTDQRAAVEFYELDFQGGKAKHVGTSEFTMDDAKRAQLAGGENWRKYPSNMLLWRAMSNGAKWFCPDAFAGAPIYTPDELGASVDPETGDLTEVVDVEGPAPVAVTSPAPAPPSAAAPDQPAATTDDRPAPVSENATDAAPASEPPADDNGQVTADEHASLAQLLDAVKAPDSFRRMALMSYGVESMSDLTKHQAREVMGKAMARFGSKGGAA
jgi:hypothetical protein